jgi:predicted RNA-binding Zn-ribbon protein involved in translation (DUF1610 family)
MEKWDQIAADKHMDPFESRTGELLFICAWIYSIRTQEIVLGRVQYNAWYSPIKLGSGYVLLQYCRGPGTNYAIASISPPGYGLRWLPIFGSTTIYSRSVYVLIPFWQVFLYSHLVLLGVIIMKRERISDLAVCQSCGYDARGIVSKICPECGSALRDSSSARSISQF